MEKEGDPGTKISDTRRRGALKQKPHTGGAHYYISLQTTPLDLQRLSGYARCLASGDWFVFLFIRLRIPFPSLFDNHDGQPFQHAVAGSAN